MTASQAAVRIRTTSEVLEHHLGAFAHGLDAVLSDYDESAVLITHGRTWRGIAEIRRFFQAFLDQATAQFWQDFRLEARCAEGEIAYVTWSSPPAVRLGTDTLLVRDGQILVQTFSSCPA